MARVTLAAVSFLLASLQAAAQAADKMQCALDGSAAADDALDAALGIYAAKKRCQKMPVGTAAQTISDGKLKCATDIISTVDAVTNMANTIAQAVQNCGIINEDDPQCGLAAGDLVGGITALAASSADITNHCFQEVDDFPEQWTNMGNCVIDASDAVHGIFDSASQLKNVKESCDNSEDCALNALNTMSAIASMGGAIAGSLNDCKAADEGFKGKPDDGNEKADCAASALGFFAALSDVASKAVTVSNECTVPDSRLYAMRQAIGSKSSSSNLFVTALVAVAAAVMGFVGGLRLKRQRVTRVAKTYEEGESTEPIMSSNIEA